MFPSRLERGRSTVDSPSLSHVWPVGQPEISQTPTGCTNSVPRKFGEESRHVTDGEPRRLSGVAGASLSVQHAPRPMPSIYAAPPSDCCADLCALVWRLETGARALDGIQADVTDRDHITMSSRRELDSHHLDCA